jgi:sec-independent protein translocase protein TatA
MSDTILFISGQEIVIVFVVVLLLFGSKRIPDFAQGLGKGMKEFKKATDDIKREIRDNTGDVIDDFKDIKNDISNETREIVKNVKKNIDKD